MGSIRKETPQALPFLRVTFKTSDVFSSWWWDLLFFYYCYFSSACSRKLKSLECFHWAGPRHHTLFLQGRWEIDLESLPALMMLWLCFMEAVFPRERGGKAIHVQLSSTHPPVGFLQSEQVVALAKVKAQGFVPWGSICASRIHFQTESSLQPSLGLIIVHTGFPAVLVAPTWSTGSSWADPKWFSFPRGWLPAQEPRNILHNIFWLLPVVTPRKCNLWIPRADFCLLWRTDGNAAFIQDCHQKVLIFGDILRETPENCSYKSGLFKTNQKGWWCPEVLGIWMQSSLSLFSWAHLSIPRAPWSDRKSFRPWTLFLHFVLNLPPGKREKMSRESEYSWSH